MDDRALPIQPIEQPARLAALVEAVRARTDLVPRIGIVLGSGLGGLADALENAVAIPFADLPGWPAATAPGHVGRLLLGSLEGVPVVLLQGRLHLYEGNSAGLVVQPVLLMGALGARTIVLTNAAGGVNPVYDAGTLMVIRDHINLTGLNPLLGQNADELGERFTDLTDAWSPRLRAALHEAGRAEGVELAEGVYIGLTGPDIRDRRRGADAAAARSRRGRDVDGPRGDRRALGGPGGRRRLARDEPGSRLRAARPSPTKTCSSPGRKPGRAWRACSAGSSGRSGSRSGQASRSRRGAAAPSRSLSMSVPGVRADVVAQHGPPGVLDAMGEAGLDADALERLQRLGDVADGDRAAALEDDEGMLGGPVAVPRVDDARQPPSEPM